MSYVKNTWKDQNVERPKTYEVTNNQDGSITLTDSFGLVQELGTPVNAVNMNHIEDGIANSADLDLSNLSSGGENHFLNKRQITDCILEAPNGVYEYSGNTFTVKAGLKFITANGFNSDKTIKNTEHILSENKSIVFSSNKNTPHIILLLVINNIVELEIREYRTQWSVKDETIDTNVFTRYIPDYRVWRNNDNGTEIFCQVLPLCVVQVTNGNIDDVIDIHPRTVELLKKNSFDVDWINFQQRPYYGRAQEWSYNVEYSVPEDGWVYFSVSLNSVANYLTPDSFIEVKGEVNDVNWYMCQSGCSWDGGGNTVKNKNGSSAMIRVWKGDKVKMFTTKQSGQSYVASTGLLFMPLIKTQGSL